MRSALVILICCVFMCGFDSVLADLIPVVGSAQYPGKIGTFYVSPSYFAILYSSDSALYGVEDAPGVVTSTTLSRSVDYFGLPVVSGYSPSYSYSFLNGAGAVGYSGISPLRLEAEFLFMNIDVANGRFGSEDDLRLFELQRSDEYVFPDNPGLPSDLRDAISLSPDDPKVQVARAVNIGTKYIFSRVSCFSFLANILVDFKAIKMAGFIPYVGAGLGASLMDFLGASYTVPIYQLRIGLSTGYDAGSAIFAGFRAIGFLKSTWRDVRPRYAISQHSAVRGVSSDIIRSGKADIDYQFGILGGFELGLRLFL